MPAYYPVYLNLEGKRCVVFGGGAVAEGKVAKLQDAGANITVISPEATLAIRAASQCGKLEWRPREYRPGDMDGAFLCIASTSRSSVNHQIFQEAERLGVLLNVVDDPSQCTFITPSIVRRGPVTLAISTGGASPALARKLRETLSTDPALDWADLAGVLSRARRQVKQRGMAVDPQRWQCCLTPQLLETAQAGREDDAFATLVANLLDGGAPDLCPQVDQCRPEGCRTRPQEPPAQEPPE